MPAAFVVGWLVLQWGHTHVIIDSYAGVGQWMHGKPSLQIICT